VTKLYWLNGPWKGRIALAARPRGGDWLKEDVADWKRAGIQAVLSLLTPEEQKELELQDEPDEVRKHGLKFSSFPIPDMQVPRTEAKLSETLDSMTAPVRWKRRSCALSSRDWAYRFDGGMLAY